MTLHRKKLLGTGQLGETYLAESTPDDSLVAVKELTRVQPHAPDEFARHIEALGRLDHPSLNKFHYLEQHDGIRRVVQDFFEATNLRAYLRRPPSRAEVKALRQRDSGHATEETDPDAPREVSAEDASDTDAAGEHPPSTEQSQSAPADDPNDTATASQDNDSTGDDPAQTTVPSERPTTGPLQAVELDTDELEEKLPDEVDPRAQLDLLLYRLEHILPQILAGLDYLHRFGHVHGDLRASNILINEEGQCRLVDYGLVTQLRPVQTSRRRFNPRNTPPDIPKRRSLEAADDVYALGCLLFELITGLHPSDLRDDAPLQPDQLPDAASEEVDPEHCEVDDLSLLQPRCPAEWVDLILRMLDSDPRERPTLDRIQDVVERTEARSVDVPPSLVPEQQSFFGRPDLLDDLTERAARCADNEQLGFTLLTGAAGTGKSALAARAIHWAAEHGWLYLRGSCYPRESLILQGWDQVAARLANVCHRLGPDLREKTAPHRRRASRLFPVLRTTDESPPTCGRRSAVDALRRLLGILADERPILIVFDDLTWASWDTTALLGDLLVDPSEFPCFIVGTWRSDAESRNSRRVRDMLQTAPIDVEWLRMRDFTEHEARSYIDSVGDHLPQTHRDLLIEQGRQNPLLLEELAFQYHMELTSDRDHERDTELLDVLASKPETPEQPDPEVSSDHGPNPSHPPGEHTSDASNPDVANRLRQLLDRRLESLDRRQQFLVEILSVAALPLPEGLLSIVLEDEFHDEQAGEQSARTILEELRKLRLVRRVDAHPWGDAFTLFHNIARTLVYRDLREQRYTHLCSRVADGLRQYWPEAKELRFEYLLRADRMDESLDLAIRSAREAADRFAYNRAAKLWRWINEHSEQSARTSGLHPERELADCEYGAGRHKEAAELFGRVADTMPESLDQLRMRYREFRAWIDAGDRRGAIDALDHGLQYFGENYDTPSLLARLSELKNRALAASSRWSHRVDATDTGDLSSENTLRAQLYFDAVRFDDILDSTRGDRFQAKLSAMAESTGHARLLGFDRILLAEDSHRHDQLTRPERASQRYDQADDLFERSDYPMGEAFSHLGRARMRRQAGDFESATDQLNTVRECYDRKHDDAEMMELHTRLERALLARDAGRLDEAISSAIRIRHLFRFSQYARFRAHALIAPIELARGRIRRANDLLERCESFVDGEPRCWYDAWLARYYSRIHIARGQPEVAFVKLEVLEEQLDASGLASVPPVRRSLDLAMGQALMARSSFSPRLGEPDATKVNRLLKQILGRLTKHITDLAPPVQSEIHRLAARWRLHKDRPRRALESAESALTALRDYPSPLARGPALETRARALQANDDDTAQPLYDAVRSVYDELQLEHPLVLEGWPVPRELSRLRDDPAA